jgi:hypothetical protein
MYLCIIQNCRISDCRYELRLTILVITITIIRVDNLLIINYHMQLKSHPDLHRYN